eukprot:513453-Lingulodinium_polyedra.AAC.1
MRRTSSRSTLSSPRRQVTGCGYSASAPEEGRSSCISMTPATGSHGSAGLAAPTSLKQTTGSG